MTYIRLRYDPKKCTGVGQCAKIAPEFFSMVDGEAELKGSSQIDGINELEIISGGQREESAVKAAQSCPRNAISVVKNGQKIVDSSVRSTDAKKILATYDDSKEFIIDKEGYFLIKVNRAEKAIEVGFCDNKNSVCAHFIGKKPIDIYTTILNKTKLDIRKDHAAYLGRELEKAYIALIYNLTYIQDDELDLNGLKR